MGLNLAQNSLQMGLNLAQNFVNLKAAAYYSIEYITDGSEPGTEFCKS
jgi:hypothetical protein